MQSNARKGEYCMQSDWRGPRPELRTASNHVMGVNLPPPQIIHSEKGTCELENLPALIGQLTAVGGDFGKVYKTRLGLALMGLE